MGPDLPAATSSDHVPHRATMSRLGIAGLVRLFLNTAVRMGYPFAPAFSRGIGVPLMTMTSGLAMSQVAGMFGLISGPMADRWGRRRMMLAGLAMVAGGMLLAGTFPSFVTVLLALVLAGLAKTFYDPALQAYVGDWVPYQQRGRVVGLIEFSWAGSLLLGIPLVALLMNQLGWRSPFLMLGAAGLVGGASILVLFPKGPQQRLGAGVTAELLGAWRLLGRETPALWMLLFGLLMGAANLNLFVIYGVWLEESFGLGVVALGATGLVIGIAELLGESITALASDRVGLKRAVIVGTVLLVLSYCLLPWTVQSLAQTLAGLFVVFICFEFVIVTHLSLVTEILPEARATMISGLIVASSLGRAMGASGGAVFWQMGGLLATSAVSAVITALGLVCVVWGLRDWDDES